MESIPQQDAHNEPTGQEINPNELRKKLDAVLQYRTIEELYALFDEGMDINQTDFQDRTALMLMAHRGEKDVVENLIARGADVNKVMMYHGSYKLVRCNREYCHADRRKAPHFFRQEHSFLKLVYLKLLEYALKLIFPIPKDP